MKKEFCSSALLTLLLFAGATSSPAAALDTKERPLSSTETSACNFFKKNDFKSALAQYNKVLAAEPNNARAFAMRGVCHIKLRNYVQARKDCDRAFSLEPRRNDCGSLANMLHDFYKESFQDEEAMTMLELAHKADPNHPGYYMTKAEMLQGEGHLKEALNNINKFVTLLPKDTDGWCRKGEIEEQLNDDRAALTSYGKCIALTPTFHVALLKQAHCWERLGDWPKAIANYTTAIKFCEGKDKSDGRSHKFSAILARADAYKKTGDTAKALKDYDTILTAATKDRGNFREGSARYAMKAGQNTANLLVSLKRFQEAVATYTELIALEGAWGGSTGLFYQERADVYRLMGKIDLAEADDARATKANATESRRFKTGKQTPL